MQIEKLLQYVEKRRHQIALRIGQLEAEANRLMAERDVIERDAFVNRHID